MLNNPLGGGGVKGLLVTKLPQIKSYAFIADYTIDRFQSRDHFTIGRHIGAHVNSELVSREL